MNQLEEQLVLDVLEINALNVEKEKSDDVMMLEQKETKRRTSFTGCGEGGHEGEDAVK